MFRGEHRIATAQRRGGRRTPEGGALEVNHGPAGAPVPGDCWEGATPDIRPGDRIRVSNPGGRAGIDEVIVDDMSIDSVSRKPGADAILGNDNDEIWVEGNARSGADGTAIDVAILDSGEFRGRLEDPRADVRVGPNEVVAGTAGRYIAKYHAPFTFVKDAVSTPVALSMLAGDGHAFGYGHVPLADGSLPPRRDARRGHGRDQRPRTRLRGVGCPRQLRGDHEHRRAQHRQHRVHAPGRHGPERGRLGRRRRHGTDSSHVVLTSGSATAEVPVTVSRRRLDGRVHQGRPRCARAGHRQGAAAQRRRRARRRGEGDQVRPCRPGRPVHDAGRRHLHRTPGASAWPPRPARRSTTRPTAPIRRARACATARRS